MDLLTQYKFIDLTHVIDEQIPAWPGATQFCKHLKVDYPQGVRVFDYLMSEGTGTHVDAPAHFIKDGRSISDLTLEELIAPLCIIDVRDKVIDNLDYAIAVNDIDDWEEKYQKIPANSVVVGFTGWSRHWLDVKRYRNMDNGVLHFPGFSKEAAEKLIQRNIAGVGIDTFSIDCGIAATYPAHHVILGAGKFQIENLVNLEQLPLAGAWIMVLPLKIKDGPEAPARIIALVQK